VTLLLATAAATVPFVLLYLLAVRFLRHGTSWMGARHRNLADRDFADLFIFVSPRQLSMVTAAFTLATLGGVVLSGLRPWLALPLLPVAIIVPRWLLGFLKARRQRRLMAQLPDALALLAGLLRAGHGLTQGLALLSANQSAPLCQELQLVIRKHRLGVPLDGALQELAERIPEPDVALVVLAVRVSREVGGNLAETLLRLSDGVRSRLLLCERIGTLTAQGKLQGAIIGLLPLILMLALTILDPQPMRLLFGTAAGWATLGVIAALEVAGFLLIRRIVRIDL
jgi:tight adherence protein B